jgi:hypothetical protein
MNFGKKNNFGAKKMKTELKIYTVEEICDGFEYNELEGKGLH